MADVKAHFEAFAGFGTRQAASEIDGAKFAKLCRECKLLGKSFTATDCDLIFSKVKAKGARKIGFTEYQAALKLVAEKKGIEYDALVAKILAAGGPASSGTQADNVKFHDDKSLYTGVYKNGGPTNVDNGTADLSNITDRSAADVRGVKK
eukprot:jgi/Ulvmu1/243/UM001_0247.1